MRIEETTALVDEQVDAASVTDEQPQSTSSEGETAPEGQAAIPEKFRGKSAEDIAKAYVELEKHIGKLGSERSFKERENDELRQRLELLERHVSSQQQAPAPQEEDLLSEFDQVFDTDPKEAMKKALEKVTTKVSRTKEEIAREFRAKAASEHYQRQMQANPDFKELEPHMQQLAHRYGNYLRPEIANSPETIDLLYKLARAENMQKYVQDAVEKSKKSSESVREEKRKAVSESSNGSGDNAKKFDDMSLEEMERYLERTVGRSSSGY